VCESMAINEVSIRVLLVLFVLLVYTEYFWLVFVVRPKSQWEWIISGVLVCAGCFFGVLFYRQLAGQTTAYHRERDIFTENELWVMRNAMISLQDDLAELRTHLQKNDPSVLDPHIFYKVDP
jgi:hypothetical protein